MDCSSQSFLQSCILNSAWCSRCLFATNLCVWRHMNVKWNSNITYFPNNITYSREIEPLILNRYDFMCSLDSNDRYIKRKIKACHHTVSFNIHGMQWLSCFWWFQAGCSSYETNLLVNQLYRMETACLVSHL